MDKQTQVRRAEAFRALHHAPKLLVLPNIWDPLGARLLEHLGYPAVATASAAVAYSLGYDDGQRIRFDVMLEVIERIAASVSIPLSADIEGGYAESPRELGDNVRRVLQAGAVGINLEDSIAEGGPLREIDAQCARIRAARAAAVREGIPLVINARTDVFLSEPAGSEDDRVATAGARARAYVESGADCIYPILLDDVAALTSLRRATGAPINVLARAGTPPMRRLEAAGISRLSLGPGLIKSSLAAMEGVARELLDYGTYDRFTSQAMSSERIAQFVRRERMPRE